VAESTAPDPDLVDRLLAGVDHLLDLVHDKVLRPVILAGRAIAFGLIIALAALMFVVALLIGLVRLLNVYAFSGHEWITYVAIGALSIIVGWVIWRKRRPLTLRK
jgi:ABC-type transport system involved in cytochrome bd biosynthesis fused ATPase/permease subunit